MNSLFMQDKNNVYMFGMIAFGKWQSYFIWKLQKSVITLVICVSFETQQTVQVDDIIMNLCWMVAELAYHSLVLMSAVLLQVCQSVHRHACYHCQYWPWQRSQVLVKHARRGYAYGLATVRGQSPTAVIKGTVLLAEPFKARENYAMVIIPVSYTHLTLPTNHRV